MARKPKSKHYLNNANLLIQIAESKVIQEKYPKRAPPACLTPELITMFKLLVQRYSQKPNWRGYSYIEDMKAEAVLVLCINALKFDHTKGSNPFGYYTQLTKNSFLTFLEKEKKQRTVKDAILIKNGFLPSFAGQVSDDTYNEGSWEDFHN